MTEQSLYFWLGAHARDALREYETQRQLERELPVLDGAGEDG